MFLGWYDPDKKKSPQQKLLDAIKRYQEKWGRSPSVALVNAADAIEAPGIEVRVATHVAPNTFYVGDDEPQDEALAA